METSWFWATEKKKKHGPSFLPTYLLFQSKISLISRIKNFENRDALGLMHPHNGAGLAIAPRLPSCANIPHYTLSAEVVKIDF